MNKDKFYLAILPLKDKLFRLALSIVHDRREAEDIVQDVLLKLWVKKDEWDEIENPEAYCFRATKNLSLDRLASSSLQLTEQVEAADNNASFIEKETPHNRFEREEQMALIRQCMERLPDNQQIAFQLRDIEGMSYKEIAQIMDISEELVKANIFRARKKIREKLLNLENDGI